MYIFVFPFFLFFFFLVKRAKIEDLRAWFCGTDCVFTFFIFSFFFSFFYYLILHFFIFFLFNERGLVVGGLGRSGEEGIGGI